MNFWKHFKAKSCSIGLEALDKELVLAEIVARMIEGDAIDPKFERDALAALIARESQASTGIGMNVAIPHVQIAGLEQAVTTLCVHPGGVKWGAIDGEPVHLFFAVLRPDRATAAHDPAKHLEMMRWIARLGRSPDFRRFAIAAKTKSELVDLLKEMAHV
ncbi:MAG: PTS sugar transporter subunit IIA [Planctomycetes bacterium]|nr:PTS sugar transporter subunit IIA [Planctomycetota bacterium]